MNRGLGLFREKSGALGVPVSELFMTRKHLLMAVLIVLLALLTGAVAQDQGGEQKKDEAKSASAEPSDGINSGGYNIHQTVEFGGRIEDYRGDSHRGTYNTFVGLHSGPRLLEYSLQMRSLPGASGQVFDRLSMSSFGYGGDPNAVTRIRMGKHKFYDFSGMFRRDKNFWDYNLFVNPYNSLIVNPYTPVPPALNRWPTNPYIQTSNHKFDMVRRMTDLGLTIAPDRIVSVRLGFGHNIMEGPSFTTSHEGGDVMLFQPWWMRTNNFRFGVDFKGIPRTRISFDQAFDWYRQDTSALNMASPVGDFVTTWQGTPNTPVNAGVIWFPNTPCANPVADSSVSPMVLTPTCSAYISYTRTMPLRGRFPTSTFTLKSSYFKDADLYFRAGYSDGEQNVANYDEAFQGRLSRTNAQSWNYTGPMHNRRVSAFADFGATIHFTDNIRLNETFYWNNWRAPALWDATETTTFSSSMAIAANTYNPATCNPGSLGGCPVHNSSSAPDFATYGYTSFHKLDTKMNLIELEVGLNRKLGFRAGYRYRNRTWVQGQGDDTYELYYPGPTLALAQRGNCAAGNPGAVFDPVTGVCTFADLIVEPNETTSVRDNAFVGGVWVRPVEALLFEFDAEISRGDKAFTRLSSKDWEEFRIRAQYKPKSRFTLGFIADLIRSTNKIEDINHNEHNRTIGFNASYFPRDWFSLDMGYDYNDFATHTNSCYNWSITGVTTPPTPTAVLDPVACDTATNTWLDNSFYVNHTHSGFFNLVLKPVKRVTTTLGYTVTSNAASSTGETALIPVFGPYSSSTAMGTAYGLNPFAPVGALGANYHLPSVLLAVDMTKRVTFKAGWNFYDYNEKYPAGLTVPRDFAANVTTLSLRYSF